MDIAVSLHSFSQQCNHSKKLLTIHLLTTNIFGIISNVPLFPPCGASETSILVLEDFHNSELGSPSLVNMERGQTLLGIPL